MASPKSESLARALLVQMRKLEEALINDAAPDESEDDARRRELTQRVLLEEGITDPIDATFVLVAMPRVIVGETIAPIDEAAFADFLEKQLNLSNGLREESDRPGARRNEPRPEA